MEFIRQSSANAGRRLIITYAKAPVIKSAHVPWRNPIFISGGDGLPMCEYYRVFALFILKGTNAKLIDYFKMTI